MEARVGIEPTIAELQSTALPLCYRAFILSFNFFNSFITLRHSLRLMGTAAQRPLF